MKRNTSSIGSFAGFACLAAMLVSGSALAAGPTEQKLHNFQGSDGSYPDAAMIADKAGNLYGTAATGGTGSCSENSINGCGIVFELSPPAQKGGSWTQTVLYNFQGGKDGAYPNASL